MFLAPPNCENCFKLVAKVIGFARERKKEDPQEVLHLKIIRGQRAWLANLLKG